MDVSSMPPYRDVADSLRPARSRKRPPRSRNQCACISARVAWVVIAGALLFHLRELALSWNQVTQETDRRRPFVGQWVAPDHGITAEFRDDGRLLLWAKGGQIARKPVLCLAGFYTVLRAEELEVSGLEWYMCWDSSPENPLTDQRNSRPESRYRFHVTDNGNRLILREPQEVLEVLRRFHSIPPREEPLEFVRRG